MTQQHQQQHVERVRTYLTQHQQHLQQRWEEITGLTQRLKLARIRETDEATRFKLEKQVQELRGDEAELEQELQQLETDLRDLDNPERVAACLDNYPLSSAEKIPNALANIQRHILAAREYFEHVEGNVNIQHAGGNIVGGDHVGGDKIVTETGDISDSQVVVGKDIQQTRVHTHDGQPQIFTGPVSFHPGAEPRQEPPGLQSEDTDILEYCKKIETLHERIPLMGFKTALRVPIRIEEIYVSLRAMIDDRLTGRSCFADAEDAEKALQQDRGGWDIALPDALLEAGERQRRGIVILGDPGSGKTTHLKRVLLWCLRGGLADLGLPQEMIPVFLPLHELKDVSKNLDDFIQDQLNQPHLGTPSGFGTRLLKRGNLLFLLDGLDEVADASHRTQISRWIERAMKIHDSCRFLVTCRFAGYTDDARLDENFLEMHIRPMTTAQAETFVRNWYQIVERSHSKDREQAAIIADSKAGDLIERLRQPDFRARRVFELTRNPLLLTNICLVHLSRGNLPHTRAALYDECTDVLLERWRGATGIRTRITSQTGRKVLQPAAFWLHQKDGRTRAPAEELAPVIEPVMKTVGWQHESAQEFLETVRNESGILTGWDQQHYGFMHLGFQEYLAAREIQNKAAFKEPAILRELASKFGQSWWQEVILLLLALDNPSVFEPFMREVVKGPLFARHQDLIELCLDDAAEKSLLPFVELIELEAGQDHDVWKRQFLALQLIARMDAQLVEDLIPALHKHPSQKIRQWLRERFLREKQTVIIAEKGGYELVFIPGGVCMMGSPDAEGGHQEDESPLHEVQLADFYLGRYPVTNEEYGRFLAKNPETDEPEYWGDRNFNQPNQPVVGVSWFDARKYAEWAGLSLPSEAQWEYACRAGTSTRYYTGKSESDLDRAGWYDENSGGKLHPVGEKEPNDFGLYDMHGNVWEWCLDWYDGNYYSKSPREDPQGPDSGSDRVYRGGSWGFVAGLCRSAYRYYWLPGYRVGHVGFRVLRTP